MNQDQNLSVFCQQHYDHAIIFLCLNTQNHTINKMCKTCNKKRTLSSEDSNARIQQFREDLQLKSQHNDVIQQTQDQLTQLSTQVSKIIDSMKTEYNQIKSRAENGEIQDIEQEISKYLIKRQKGIVEIEKAFDLTQKQVINNLKIVKYQNDFESKFDGYSLLKLYERKVLNDNEIIFNQQRWSQFFSNQYQQTINTNIEAYCNLSSQKIQNHQQEIENEITNFKNKINDMLKKKQEQLDDYKQKITCLQKKQTQQLISSQREDEFFEQFKQQQELLDEFRLFYYSQQSSVAELTNLGTLQLYENYDKLQSIYSLDYFPIQYDQETKRFLSLQREFKFSSYYASTTTTFQNNQQTIQSIQTFELDGQKGNYEGQLNSLNQPQGRGKFKVDDQDFYIGNWQNGMRHGKGIQILLPNVLNGFPFPIQGKLTYTGDWMENKKHGQGEIIGEMFHLIDVHYFNDILQSCQELKLLKMIDPIKVPIKITNLEFDQGAQTTKIFKVEYIGEVSKCIYLGELNNLQFHGKGELEEQQEQGAQNYIKRKLSGEWENGFFKKGKEMIRVNDELVETYDGEWNNNLYSGQGTQIIYDYEFFINKFFGESREQGINGKYVGQFVNGLREGQGQLINCDNLVQYSGQWEKGEANGEGTLTGDNFTLTGNFEKYLLQGQVTFSQIINGNAQQVLLISKMDFTLKKKEGGKYFEIFKQNQVNNCDFNRNTIKNGRIVILYSIRLRLMLMYQKIMKIKIIFNRTKMDQNYQKELNQSMKLRGLIEIKFTVMISIFGLLKYFNQKILHFMLKCLAQS